MQLSWCARLSASAGRPMQPSYLLLRGILQNLRLRPRAGGRDKSGDVMATTLRRRPCTQGEGWGRGRQPWSAATEAAGSPALEPACAEVITKDWCAGGRSEEEQAVNRGRATGGCWSGRVGQSGDRGRPRGGAKSTPSGRPVNPSHKCAHRQTNAARSLEKSDAGATPAGAHCTAAGAAAAGGS